MVTNHLLSGMILQVGGHQKKTGVYPGTLKQPFVNGLMDGWKFGDFQAFFDVNRLHTRNPT